MTARLVVVHVRGARIRVHVRTRAHYARARTLTRTAARLRLTTTVVPGVLSARRGSRRWRSSPYGRPVLTQYRVIAQFSPGTSRNRTPFAVIDPHRPRVYYRNTKFREAVAPRLARDNAARRVWPVQVREPRHLYSPDNVSVERSQCYSVSLSVLLEALIGEVLIGNYSFCERKEGE